MHRNFSNYRQDIRTCILQNCSVINTSRARRSRKKAFKVSTLIIIAYTVCWLPYNVLAAWNIIDTDSYRKIEDHVYWGYSLIALNTLINPLIYGPTKLPSFKNLRRWISNWRVMLLSDKRSSKKVSNAIAAKRRAFLECTVFKQPNSLLKLLRHEFRLKLSSNVIDSQKGKVEIDIFHANRLPCDSSLH
uniref:G-protein coupled receptors family 1 profile domain-containing protein n=1 Tax=Romanomermis culicivorax TaxID=13658 RepID=A0A915I7G2_ROMCU